jgi:hypothetical protein
MLRLNRRGKVRRRGLELDSNGSSYRQADTRARATKRDPPGAAALGWRRGKSQSATQTQTGC